ncbi:MAG: hypothetical protein V1799_05195 [bacterium]
MKRYAMFLLGITVVATLNVHSQNFAKNVIPGGKTSVQHHNTYSPAYLQKAKKQYLQCLRERHEAIVEAALAHVAYLRIVAPDENVTELQKQIAILARDGITENIKIKAAIVQIIFTNPLAYENLLESKGLNSNQFFSASCQRIMATYFAGRE